MPNLKTFTAADFARKTGDVLFAASRRPVVITKHKKPRFVLMNVEHYETMTNTPKSSQVGYTLEDMPPDLRQTLIAALERDLAADEEIERDE